MDWVRRALGTSIVGVAIVAALAALPGSATAGAYVDFFRAVERDDARTVRALLERGFDPNAPSEQGHPALYLALREEAAGVVDVLLAHPELRVDAASAADETPLMMAALRGRLDWVQRLVKRGAAINRAGWTPLHYAASGPEPRVVAWLLEHGAAIDAPSPNRSTPLMMAAGYGAIDGAILLLERRLRVSPLGTELIMRTTISLSSLSPRI